MDNQQYEERIAQGWNLISEEAWPEAIALAESLIETGEVSGYRIKAAAQQLGQEDLEAAKATLSEAIHQSPEAWDLRMQFATLLAEMKDYEEAHTQLEQAIALPEAEEHWVTYNKAILLLREERWEEGLNLLQELEHPEVINDAFCLQMEVLDAFGQYDTILEMAEADLELMQVPGTMEEATTMARICTYIATAAWYEEKGGEMVRHYLKQAFVYDRTLDDALWLLRELEGEFHDDSKVYTLQVQGLLLPESPEEGLLPFVAQFGVVARSPEAAFDMVRRFEQESVKPDSLSFMVLEEADKDDDFEDGIYMVTPYQFPEDVSADS
ncbi:MAG: hypothetical protein D6722_06980 [Bacteroidetes bacterium]|nr:MAG: hypothetical protein D6722_06980 [Bacteroidota bacterium]